MSVKEELLASWKRSRQLTKEVAEAMPAEKWDFRPTDDVMSFREQVLHILAGEQWFLRGMQEGEWEFRPEITLERYPDMASTLEAVTYWTDRHAELISSIEDLDAKVTTPLKPDVPLPKRILLQGAITHEVHHRGQLIVYLRLNGIQPPAFRF
ncbi:DNA damage-inducible protein DinB [Marinithermofilum abyssi]|uniref:DNA damage-inducible protein DinB n=1 Tax=Marinithermofilum abyssi TaxID=1571185 RepID=A0A8J2VEY8_9BACL|nr:DinB family protein [Marinithermofilum abyssi]GGE15013.1 DNA damage-inducible protein DinB [Marinithermofilum abyssi]